MADKTFHLRANEVRAESRALMQKLRAERLAATRHRPRSATTSVVEITPAHLPAPVMTAIIPSRKIQAAVDTPVAAKVEAAFPEQAGPAEKPAIPAKPKRAAKPLKAMAQPIIAEAAPELPVPTPVVEHALTPELESVLEPVLDAVEPAAVEPARKLTAKRKPKPAPVEAAPATPQPVAAQEPVAVEKPRKPRKTSRPVKQIIAEGFGSIAELQQAVAAAIVVAPASSPATAVTSPRAKESIASIPTLGPGMVWRLNQLGIRTLGDLAAMGEDDLRAKLGPVAKLVRVENWISYAKAA